MWGSSIGAWELSSPSKRLDVWVRLSQFATLTNFDLYTNGAQCG